MNVIFFSTIGNLDQVSEAFFSNFIDNNFLKGDSENLLGGSYYDYPILGIRIKIELNSYDYEDKYRFMISISKDYRKKIKVDPSVEDSITDALATLIAQNFNVTVAKEIAPNNLKMFYP